MSLTYARKTFADLLADLRLDGNHEVVEILAGLGVALAVLFLLPFKEAHEVIGRHDLYTSRGLKEIGPRACWEAG